MTSVTQKINSVNGGISQQPDELKIPGQVVTAKNVFPDVTHGLQKRTGSLLIQNLTAGTKNSYTTGKWFSYYRDENEQYIGQIIRRTGHADDGVIRMWRCSDGQEMDVLGNTGAITTYLQHTDDDEIQTLTLNDFTFINNRTKATAMLTGGSDVETNRPPEAFIDLKQIKYASQYAVNLYDQDGSQTSHYTSVRTATRIHVNRIVDSSNSCRPPTGTPPDYTQAQRGQFPPSGTLPMIFYTLRTATNAELVSQNGFELILLNHANPVAALISSIIVFLVVAYAESSKLELPLTHGKVRGHRGQYPIRLVYASNIPVILMAALLANVNMFTLLFWSHPVLSTVPILGKEGSWSMAHWFGSYEPGATTPSGGFAWYSSMVNGVGDWLIPLLNQSGDAYGHELWQIMVHVIVYVTFMTVGSTIFAKFWIETTNMGAKDVAKQIERTGMQIPGFRKNPVVLERILERYIPPVTVFSGAFVGLLAAGADPVSYTHLTLPTKA